jgi:hypothetical protein
MSVSLPSCRDSGASMGFMPPRPRQVYLPSALSLTRGATMRTFLRNVGSRFVAPSASAGATEGMKLFVLRRARIGEDLNDKAGIRGAPIGAKRGICVNPWLRAVRRSSWLRPQQRWAAAHHRVLL